jgi:hypothetical protein
VSVSRIRGIAKLLEQVRQLDSAEPFEVEAEDELPFVQLGHWVALSGVSPGALALYWMLALHLNRTRGDRYVWPTTDILAHMLGYSRGDKIKRFVDELIAIGAIRVISVPDLRGPQKRNVYRLRRTPPEGYTGLVSLKEFYAQLDEAYEQETAGEAVSPQTGGHVTPETGGDVAPETGGHVGPRAGAVTTRTPNYMNGKDAPTARSAADGRRPTTGSRSSRAGGSAASGKSKPPSLTPVQRQQVDALFQALPKELADLVPTNPPGNLKAAVLEALAFGQPEERTAGQLVDFRLLPKWDKHYSRRDQAGPIKKPVGVLIEMLKWDAECGDKRCDERTNVDTSQLCISCEQRGVEKRAERAAEQAAKAPESPSRRSELPVVPSVRKTPTKRPERPVPPPREVSITEVSDQQRALARAAVFASRGRNRVSRMP